MRRPRPESGWLSPHLLVGGGQEMLELDRCLNPITEAITPWAPLLYFMRMLLPAGARGPRSRAAATPHAGHFGAAAGKKLSAPGRHRDGMWFAQLTLIGSRLHPHCHARGPWINTPLARFDVASHFRLGFPPIVRKLASLQNWDLRGILARTQQSDGYVAQRLEPSLVRGPSIKDRRPSRRAPAGVTY